MLNFNYEIMDHPLITYSGPKPFLQNEILKPNHTWLLQIQTEITQYELKKSTEINEEYLNNWHVPKKNSADN